MWRAVERWGSQIKSGLNFDFLSRLFSKPKSYSQFESTEDIFSDAKEDLIESDEDDVILMRDSDPYDVGFERRQNKRKPYGTHNAEIHSSKLEEKVTGNKELDNSGAHDTDERTLSVRYTSKGHRRQGSNVREDVGGYVTCVIQRQYNKLGEDVSDDEHVTSDQHEDQRDGTFCDNAKQGDSNVFHSIKDVKAKKPKRRKKVRVFQFLRRITSFTSRNHAYARTK